MIDRRRFLLISAFGGVSLTAGAAWSAVDPYQRVILAESAIAKSVAGGGKPSADAILSSLGTADMTPAETRIAIFELVRRVLYKLTSWKGVPESLFALGRGDCRHKAAAATLLLKKAGFKAEHRVVTFDWADLPLPRDMLDQLTDTRSFHDTVYVWIDGKPVLFDATWDPALAKAGFPILDGWDGNSPTLSVTFGTSQLVDVRAIPKGTNLYDHFGYRWPERKKTLAFNRLFNAWSDEVRGSADPIAAFPAGTALPAKTRIVTKITNP